MNLQRNKKNIRTKSYTQIIKEIINNYEEKVPSPDAYTYYILSCKSYEEIKNIWS